MEARTIIKNSGALVRLDLQSTIAARLARYRASYNARAFPGLTADDIPTPEQFPYHKRDLRFTHQEQKGKQ
jgi:hypothetical protein